MIRSTFVILPDTVVKTMVFVHVMRTDSWWNELQTSFAISYTIFPGIPSSVISRLFSSIHVPSA